MNSACQDVSSLMLGALIWMSAVPAAAQPESAQEPEDWPSRISWLRQQLYQRPGQASVRQQLATAYNNYGVALGNQGRWGQAILQMEEALRLDAENGQFRTNAGNLYVNQAREAYERHQPNEALAALDQALALKPDLAQAYALRGQIEYDRQKLKEAKAAWQRALELDPAQPDLAGRLAQVTEELPVESKFKGSSQAYFDLRYDKQLEEPIGGFDLRDALLDARRAVGSDFAYWPKHKIVVLVYSAESFRALRAEMPDWVGGQFDGKIRVPLPSEKMDQATVRQVLFHEYTHALIHDLTNGRCPTWLNEGFAEYEGRTQSPGSLTRLRKAQDAQRLIPWPELSGRFSFSLSGEEVALAYEQAYSVVAYLKSRYGFWRFRRLLKAVGEGTGWEAAFTDEFRVKPPRLERQWIEWLPELLRTGPS